MLINLNRDSDTFDTTATAETTSSDYFINSSSNQSTMSSSRESYSSSTTTTTTIYCRHSFDTTTTSANTSFQNHRYSSPENRSLLKPHRSSDSAFEAIVSASNRRKTSLTFRDFKIIGRIGSGDIGTVYLCRLRSGKDGGERFSDDEFAMKVVDKEVLRLKNKMERAEMEKKILKLLDHPFLPTLYAEFDALNFSCIVMEYCSGGDLHSLRHKLPSKRFSISAARFYAAEVLVALEYLHMLGIIYRDLKPENVLVRSDGHIMLSDFDLSLYSHSTPAVQWPTPADHHPNPSSSISSPTLNFTKNATAPRTSSFASSSFTASARPFSCLPIPNRLSLFRSKKVQSLNENKLFVAEPVSAKSSSFVGTHEYVSPEVASGRSHGNAVDWWSFGIFIYEMIYGHTPFVGPTPSNESTLRNILKKPLTFPTDTSSSSCEHHARDLISRLLDKDPVTRLGAKRGAAEVKTHPFFKGLNFALVRSMTPPEVPGLRGGGPSTAVEEVVIKKRKESLMAFDYF